MLRISIYFFLLFLILLPSNPSAQQNDSCSEPRVAVFLKEIDDKVFDHLYRQHPFQPKEAWLRQIQDKAMQELRKNSPKTQFISTNGKSPEGCQYYFHYILWLTTAGEEKEIAGLKKSAYSAYWMISGLGRIGMCRVPPKVFNHANTIDNPDIFQTIEQNIAVHGNIGDRIKEYEETHLVPARGPELEVSQEPEKVSPLEEENKLDIKIKVINCEGESVYDKRYGQYIFLPRKTDRGELKPTDGFNQKSSVSENVVTLRIISPEGASATYTLKKGIDSGLEHVKISTCGLDENAVTETEIHISGLEIKVTPRRRSLRPGEKTQIQLEFSKVDKDGNKEPAAGKKLKIEIKGLVNGSVAPEGDIQTDGEGKATLTYRAGDQDKKVKFVAKYRPKDFNEFVQGKGIVNVKKITAGIHATLTKKYTLTCIETGPPNYTDTKTEIIATIDAEFEYEKSRKIRRKSIIEEHYKLKSWEISDAQATETRNYVFISRDPKYHQGIRKKSVSTGRTKGTVNKSDMKREILEIQIDPKTGKAIKVDFPSFNLDIHWPVLKVKTDTTFGDVDWHPMEGKYHASRSYSFEAEVPERRVGFVIDEGERPEGPKVKSGDGIRNLGGGSRTVERLGGCVIVERVYSWEIMRNVSKTRK